MTPPAIERWVQRLARWSYTALLALVLFWEAWAAPATPVSRIFWLALKGLPLLVAIPGLLRDSAQVYVLATLLVLLYFSDGIALTYSAIVSGPSPTLAYAVVETIVSLVFIGAAPFHARFIWRRATARAGAETES